MPNQRGMPSSVGQSERGWQSSLRVAQPVPILGLPDNMIDRFSYLYTMPIYQPHDPYWPSAIDDSTASRIAMGLSSLTWPKQPINISKPGPKHVYLPHVFARHLVSFAQIVYELSVDVPQQNHTAEPLHRLLVTLPLILGGVPEYRDLFGRVAMASGYSESQFEECYTATRLAPLGTPTSRLRNIANNIDVATTLPRMKQAIETQMISYADAMSFYAVHMLDVACQACYYSSRYRYDDDAAAQAKQIDLLTVHRLQIAADLVRDGLGVKYRNTTQAIALDVFANMHTHIWRNLALIIDRTYSKSPNETMSAWGYYLGQVSMVQADADMADGIQPDDDIRI